MLTNDTRAELNDYLLNVGHRYIDENLDDMSIVGGSKPFHERLLPSMFEGRPPLSERSFSTRSGNWFQEMARIIASQYHPVVVKNYTLSGRIRSAAVAHIAAIIEDMERGKPKRKPDRKKDISEVLGVQDDGGEDKSTISDLHITTIDDKEYYFELKTPKPNKDQSKAMKSQILLISALRKGANAHAHASTAYNPYGDEQPYIWNYANQFLETGTDNLIGRDFWTTIGEKSTYDELLELSKTVGEILDNYLTNKL